MELNAVKEAALLSWINSVCPEEPINKITQIMDGHRLLKLALRVQGKESRDDLFASPSPNMIEMVFSMLQDDFQFSPRQASLMFWKISQRIELELQIAKVVLVLCYCGFKKHNMVPLDTKTGLMIASMFHFVEDDAEGLSLDDDLNKFLTKASVMTFSTSSSGSSCCSPLYTDESPFSSRFQKPTGVQFQRLVTVACGSDCSPLQEVMSTPQLLKRLRKELAHEGDVRDELEKELADQINIISEKEGLIIQLQHRVDRMLKEQRELEKDHKAALLELQEKNESLLHRVHEVVKQCQDLKNSSYQKTEKILELMEENQTVSAQALTKIESLQTHILDLSEQISLKDEEIRNLRNEYDSVDHELKLVKEQNIEINETLNSNRKEHEETVKKLQQELHSVSSAASEKQEEMLVLSVEVTSLKEQICRYSETEVQKQQEMSVLETQLDELKKSLTAIQNQFAEATVFELWHQETLREESQELEKIVRELQTEIPALSSERDTQIRALKTEIKNQRLKSDKLRAQLKLKLEKQTASILTLKNLARQWEQQNTELLEKLQLFKRLQHCRSKNQALQMDRDQVAFAEKRLQEGRRMIDDDVRGRESLKVRKRPGFHLHGLDTPELSASSISRTTTAKSRHANRPSNSQPKQRKSVMFVIPNTPKSSGGGSLLRRGLKLHKDSCKTPTVVSRGLGPAVSTNSRSPRVSALRKHPRESSKTSNAKLGEQ